MAKYYSLCICFDGYWSPEFGDFERETVEFERDEYLENPSYDLRKKDVVILVCKDASRAALIEAYEKKFGIECPIKNAKERWKSAYSEYRETYHATPKDEICKCETILEVNGARVAVTNENDGTFSIQREVAQDGVFSRIDFHDHLNVVMMFAGTPCRHISKDILIDMNWCNRRSRRLGFELPA